MSKWVQLGVVEWVMVVLEEERRIARILGFVTSLLSRREYFIFLLGLSSSEHHG